MIYHLLPEMEEFSAYRGGAIAKDIANLMRFDESRVVACRTAEDTWGFEPDRVIVIPALHNYAKLKGRGRIPISLAALPIRIMFRSFLSILKVGDIVWCHNQPFFAAALEHQIHLRGAKLLYHGHDGRSAYAVRNAFRSFTADAYVFVSEFLRQQRLETSPHLRNTYAIHNGADESLFYPLPAKKPTNSIVPTILCIGRLHREKGFHVLIEAMRILQGRKVNVLCKVVGSSFTGGSKPTRYVKSLHNATPSNTQFVGYCIQETIADQYRSADILCCPSIWQEPFGNINIEAMACGVPVVATRVGGIPEIASEGGVLMVEPNSPTELADALQKLIEDKDLHARVAAEGLASFRHRFTWSEIYKQCRAVIDVMSRTELDRKSAWR